MLKGIGSLESEFRRLADSQSSNLGKVYESVLNLILAKHSEKKKGLTIEKKPKSKELGVKVERKSPKDLGLRVENEGKSKIIERGANEVSVLPEVPLTAPAKESLAPKLLYEYSKSAGKSKIMMSPQEAKTVLQLIDKSTKEGDVIENGAGLKVSDSNKKVLFETDSKGVVIYSQHQRDASILKKDGLGSAMALLRSDVSNVISRAEGRQPLSKDVEEPNQSAMPLDEELLERTTPSAKPVQKDQDIPRTTAGKKKANLSTSFADNSMVPSFTSTAPKPLKDQEKVSLLNQIGLEPRSSIDMKGGSLSVSKFPNGSLSVMFSDKKGADTVIAHSSADGEITASPQFSDQVASVLQEHISELPRGVEKVSPPIKAPIPVADKSAASTAPTVSKTVVVPPKELSDQEKIRLLNNPDLGLEPRSSVEMKGGKLSVEQHEGTLIVFFSDGERAGEQIASVENGMTKISPQFSGQVASMMQEHISELPHQVEREFPEIDELEAEDDYDYEH